MTQAVPLGRTLCVGAAHWDVIGRADSKARVGDDLPGRIEQRPGGVAMNVALGMAALSCPVSLCAVVGTDGAGDALIRHAASAGIDCAHVLQIAEASTDAYLAIEDDAGNLVAAVAEAGLLEAHTAAIADQAEAALDRVETVFLDANLPADSIGCIAECATAAGVEIVANPVSPAKALRLARLLSNPHRPVIVANLQEANVLLRQTHDNARDAAEALLHVGARTAFVTDGSRAVALATSDDVFTSMPVGLPYGASVTGAGDALLAAFLSSPDRHRNLRSAMEFSLKAAARHMTTGI